MMADGEDIDVDLSSGNTSAALASLRKRLLETGELSGNVAKVRADLAELRAKFSAATNESTDE